ncbi:MAG: Eco57I restriction-modification methylase domain-containing protein [Gemmatimonadales bacterium]
MPTPERVVDAMVDKLFDDSPPREESLILDPGCGSGAFVQGLIRWSRRHKVAVPGIVGIESDHKHIPEARRGAEGLSSISILNEDFLDPRTELFDYIIGNPPYVPITDLTVSERGKYRERYGTAKGRFDLYLLFYEQALRLLKPSGRLVFITPEKFLYVRTAEPLRRALARFTVEEIHLVDETTFGDLVTYPAITTIVNTRALTATRVILRDGSRREVRLPADGTSWLPAINGDSGPASEWTLADICRRISCGVATGADAVFVTRTDGMPANLKRFAFPTIAGREIRIGQAVCSSHSILVPYGANGDLLGEDQLGELGSYLSQPEQRGRLTRRTCVLHKPWYAFHETPPLNDILRPKILCKDIASQPFFLPDETGEIVPRHSVYYIVPKDPSQLPEICDYLNSPVARAWLKAHCQRAANGFLRLQSHVLKNTPVPSNLATAHPETLFAGVAANR